MTSPRPGTDWQLGCMELKQRGSHLLQSGQWSDCTFLVGSEHNRATVKAHKLILACASPVFEAMFFGGMAEKDDPIEILDVQPEAFETLLQYIYTDKAAINTFEIACSVYYGAKKYMLPYLEKECTWYISLNLNPQNVCCAFEVAQLFDEKLLMDKCINVLVTRTKEVLNDDSFEEAEISTLLTLLSQDNLAIDSELDLFKAIEKYANIHPSGKSGLDSSDMQVSPSKKLKRDSLEMGDALAKMFETSLESKEIESNSEVKNSETNSEVKVSKSKSEDKNSESNSKVKSSESNSEVKSSESNSEVKSSETNSEAKSSESKSEVKDSETNSEVEHSESKCEVKDSESNSEVKSTESKSEVKVSGSVTEMKIPEQQAGPVVSAKGNRQNSFDANNNNNETFDFSNNSFDNNSVAASVRSSLRDAVCKIRFLTLTAQQFAGGPARSALLSESEAFAVLMNILSSQAPVPMPQGFSTCRVSRTQQTVSQEDPEHSKSEVVFRFTVLNFKTRVRSVESRPFSFHDMMWTVKMVPRFENDTSGLEWKYFGIHIKCCGRSDTAWAVAVRARVRVVPQDPARAPLAADLRRTFTSKENVWGFERFMKWEDAMDPARGFVKGNTLVIETRLVLE